MKRADATKITIHEIAAETNRAVASDLRAAARYRDLAAISEDRREEWLRCALESEESAERWRADLRARLRR